MVDRVADVPYLLRSVEEKIFCGPSLDALPQRERLQEVNQGILASEGVHTPILEFLHRVHQNVATKRQHVQAFSPPMAEVIRTCYLFLFYFTWQNPANAQLLSTKTVLRLLCAQLAWWDGVELAALLTNVLVNNDAANQVALPHTWCAPTPPQHMHGAH